MNDIKIADDIRKDIAPYRVYLTWDVTYTCNYRCSYCSLGRGEELARKPKTKILSPDEWEKIWQDVYERYGSCQIHFTGGEPFNYPEAIEIISRVVKYHTFECSTNLSWNEDEFIAKIDPERARVGTSYHPEMVDFEEFFTKVAKLKKAGFEVWSNYVAYPPFIKDLASAKDRFSSIGVHMSILPFNGRYEDKDYPAAYDAEQRKYLNDLGADLPWVKKTMDWMMNKPADKQKQSKNCLMGMMYAKIHPDGEANRCCAENATYLGNLIKGTFRLLDKPEPCENETCPCWKSMVLTEEDRWAAHWPVPPAGRREDGK